jgi:hypothetical protein
MLRWYYFTGHGEAEKRETKISSVESEVIK